MERRVAVGLRQVEELVAKMRALNEPLADAVEDQRQALERATALLRECPEGPRVTQQLVAATQEIVHIALTRSQMASDAQEVLHRTAQGGPRLLPLIRPNGGGRAE